MEQRFKQTWNRGICWQPFIIFFSCIMLSNRLPTSSLPVFLTLSTLDIHHQNLWLSCLPVSTTPKLLLNSCSCSIFNFLKPSSRPGKVKPTGSTKCSGIIRLPKTTAEWTVIIGEVVPACMALSITPDILVVWIMMPLRFLEARSLEPGKRPLRESIAHALRISSLHSHHMISTIC